MELVVLYDETSKKYQEIKSQLELRLLSKTKKTDARLVGRITFDVSEVLNGKISSFENKEFKLDFCSVNAVIKIMF